MIKGYLSLDWDSLFSMKPPLNMSLMIFILTLHRIDIKIYLQCPISRILEHSFLRKD